MPFALFAPPPGAGKTAMAGDDGRRAEIAGIPGPRVFFNAPDVAPRWEEAAAAAPVVATAVAATGADD